MFDHIEFSEPTSERIYDSYLIEVYYGGEFICKGIATKEKEIQSC